MTSTGSGIAHSEFNRHTSDEVHFCQIWAIPDRTGLKPRYYTRHFTDQEKRDRLVKVVSPADDADAKDARAASGPAPVSARPFPLASRIESDADLARSTPS